LFVFYFANGGYIIRISPIAKGIVVPGKIDEIAAGRKEVTNGLMPWQGISRVK
jgi:hypothetical protein